MIRHSLAFSILMALLSSCSDQGKVVPPTTDDSNLQHDLPWESVAQTGWAMHQGNPQATGRSAFPGPSQGVIAWSIDLPLSEIGVTVASDSHFIAGNTEGLYAFRLSDGGLLWKFDLPRAFCGATPAVARDGTVYLGSIGQYLYAFEPTGRLKWQLMTEVELEAGGLTIGKDGTVYISGIGYLYAVHPDGTLRWKLVDARIARSNTNSISPDGSTLYVPGHNVVVLAVDAASGSVLWTFGTCPGQFIQQSPLVDNSGRIYLLHPSGEPRDGGPGLYCLNRSGQVVWKYSHLNRFDPVWAGDLTMDREGNLVFALDTVYSLTHSGKLRWKVSLDGFADAPLVSDALGNVYVIRWRTTQGAEEVLCFSKDGGIIWRVPFLLVEWNGESPALTRDGILLTASYKGTKLFAIR